MLFFLLLLYVRNMSICEICFETFNKEEILLPAEEKAKRKSEIEKLKALKFFEVKEFV